MVKHKRTLIKAIKPFSPISRFQVRIEPRDITKSYYQPFQHPSPNMADKEDQVTLEAAIEAAIKENNPATLKQTIKDICFKNPESLTELFYKTIIDARRGRNRINALEKKIKEVMKLATDALEMDISEVKMEVVVMKTRLEVALSVKSLWKTGLADFEGVLS